MAHETDPLIFKSSHPDEALNLVGSKITRYVTEIGNFEKMVPRYGSPADTTEFRKQISAKREEIVHMYKVIVNDIKELKSVVHGMQKVKLDKMTDQFEQTHKEYQKYSEASIHKDRSYHPIFVEPPPNPVRQYQQSHPLPQQHYQQTHSATQPPPLSQQYYQASSPQLYQEDPVALIVEERNKDMAQVARDMALLKEVYVDVNKLAVEQGMVLEQAHKNTNQADERVEDGVKDLRQAEKYTHSYRRKLVVLSVIILLVLAVVGVVLYLYLKGIM